MAELNERLMDGTGDAYAGDLDTEYLENVKSRRSTNGDGARPGGMASMSVLEPLDGTAQSSAGCVSIPLFQVGLCFCVAMLCGTYYAFGTYVEELKTKGQFSQTQVHTAGVVLDLGVYSLGPVIGDFHDYVGSRISLAVSTVLGGAGYLMVSRGVDQPAGSDTNSIWFFAVAFFFIGFSNRLGYIAAMYTSTSSCSVAARPLTVAAVSTPMGISSIMLAVTYHERTPPGFSEFFLTWGVCSAVVFGLGAFLLRPDLHEKRHQSGGDNADPPERRRPDLPLPARDAAARGLGDLAQRTWRNFYSVTSTRTFLHLAGPCSLVLGTGLMATNNAGGIARALDPGNYLPDTYRLTVSYCVAATVSRLLVTWCMSKLSWGYGSYIVINCTIAAASQACFAIFDIDGMYLSFLMIGFATGGLWPPAITILRGSLSKERFGMGLGAFSLGPGLVGLGLNLMASVIYDGNIEPDSGVKPKVPPNVCVGESCYLISHFVSFGCCLVAVVWSMRLVPLTPKPKAAPKVPKAPRSAYGKNPYR